MNNQYYFFTNGSEGLQRLQVEHRVFAKGR